MTSRAPSTKNLEIEYLRGVAVSLAILTHLPILLPYHSNFFVKVYNVWAMPGTGVDLFFCISGFVVSRAFLDFFERGRDEGRLALSLQTFWIRRFFRLLPTAWLWVVAGLACSVFFNSTGTFATPYENLRSAAVVATACGNYANQFGMLLHPNDAYWSLALEEQFYLLFPFLILGVPARWRVRALLALIALQFGINRNINMFTTPAIALAAAFRVDAILWGVLIHLFSRSPQHRQAEPTFLQRSPVAAAVLNAVLFYLLVAIPAQFALLPTTMGIVAMLAAVLVLLASFERGYVTPFPPLTRLFTWLGARSYGVYIIHLFAYRVTFEGWSRLAAARGTPLNAADTAPMVLTAAALLLLLAELNYRFVEVPLRNRGIRLAKARWEEATTPA